MFLSMLIGLFTSRLVLQALGVSDFGLFNAVGGIIGLFTFIAGSLAATTTRFINVEMGKPDGDLNKVFNACNVLHLLMALLIFVITETGGVYYIHHFLNVEPGKEHDAMFIFQVSIIVSCIGITNVPYNSLFNATEKFLFNAIVGIGTKVFQLLVVIWLLHFDGNRVRAYSIIMSGTSLASCGIYYYYCHRYWPDVIRWKFVREKRLYKEAAAFNGYNLLSTAALMARSQGSSLLINYFFGTITNGAFAVAKSVEGYVMAFAGNFDGAAGPQITQSYAKGDLDRVMYLTCKIGKYCILLMLIAFFPLVSEMDMVLHFWLEAVPDGALEFCNMTLLVALVSATGGGIVQVLHASGKIAPFKITFSIMMLACIPLGFWMFKNGAAPYLLVALFAAVDAVWRVIQLLFLRKIINFPVMTYVREAYLPPLKVAILVVPVIILTSLLPMHQLAWHLSRFIIILIVTLLACSFIGLTKNERKRVYATIKNKFFHTTQYV